MRAGAVCGGGLVGDRVVVLSLKLKLWLILIRAGRHGGSGLICHGSSIKSITEQTRVLAEQEGGRGVGAGAGDAKTPRPQKNRTLTVKASCAMTRGQIGVAFKF